MFNPDNRVNHYLNEEELRRLLTVLRTDRNRMICRLVLWLLATGCRYSEAINARWRDIDRQNRRWLIAQETSKNKRSRWAGLSETALEILDELAPETGGHEHLFVNRSTGKVYASTKKVWDRLRNAAGLPHFRLHDCRHQFASMLANRGVNLLTIKEQLGHLDVRMTASRYSHISASTLATASQVAGDAMREAMRPPAPGAASGPAAVAPRLDAANAPRAVGEEAEAAATPPAGGRPCGGRAEGGVRGARQGSRRGGGGTPGQRGGPRGSGRRAAVASPSPASRASPRAREKCATSGVTNHMARARSPAASSSRSKHSSPRVGVARHKERSPASAGLLDRRQRRRRLYLLPCERGRPITVPSRRESAPPYCLPVCMSTTTPCTEPISAPGAATFTV